MKLHKCPICLDFLGPSYHLYMHFRGDHRLSEEVSLSLWWAVIAVGQRSSGQQRPEFQACRDSRASLVDSSLERFRNRERTRFPRAPRGHPAPA
jgi:hypothetical protein